MWTYTELFIRYQITQKCCTRPDLKGRGATGLINYHFYELQLQASLLIDKAHSHTHTHTHNHGIFHFSTGVLEGAWTEEKFKNKTKRNNFFYLKISLTLNLSSLRIWTVCLFFFNSDKRSTNFLVCLSRAVLCCCFFLNAAIMTHFHYNFTPFLWRLYPTGFDCSSLCYVSWPSCLTNAHKHTLYTVAQEATLNWHLIEQKLTGFPDTTDLQCFSVNVKKILKKNAE